MSRGRSEPTLRYADMNLCYIVRYHNVFFDCPIDDRQSIADTIYCFSTNIGKKFAITQHSNGM